MLDPIVNVEAGSGRGGGYVRLEERAGGMDRGGASSDAGRGKQGRCCVWLDYKVVVVGIGGISQFY